MTRLLFGVFLGLLGLSLAACDLFDEDSPDGILSVDEATVADAYDVDDIDLSAIEFVYADGDSKDRLTFDAVRLSSEMPADVGGYLLAVEYEGATTTFEVVVDVFRTVVFESHDEETLEEISVRHGYQAEAPDAPQRDGYDFIGWDTAFEAVTEDLTVTAKYEAITHTVVFEDYDGTTLFEQVLGHGETANAPDEPNREGHDFLGWDKAVEAVTEDLTVIARYEPTTYTVVFEDYDGTIISEQQVVHGADAPLPLDPSRVGYTFVGWDGDHENIEADTIVTAEYEALEGMGSLTVHYIDVGQADATFIEGPNHNILVDAGRTHWNSQNVTVDYLDDLGVETIDLVIGTHPHLDHIGDLEDVLDAFDAGKVWKSGYVHDTATYGRIHDAIEAAKNAGEIDYLEPRFAHEKTLGQKHLQVLNPTDGFSSIHDASISFILSYGEVDFLFTGDAEEATEAAMIDRVHDHGWSLDVDVYQAGHHGSDTSSTLAFMEAMMPSTVVYSAGEGNQYNHPGSMFLHNVQTVGATLYGTDVNGTIRVLTDGSTYDVETEAGDPVAPGSLHATGALPALDGSRWRQ